MLKACLQLAPAAPFLSVAGDYFTPACSKVYCASTYLMTAFLGHLLFSG